MFNDAIIVVTGGTVSFGDALVSTILRSYKPKKLIVFSRNEIKLREMAKKFRDSCVRFFIGDVRGMYRTLADVEYVVHEAATKIAPIAEYNPFEDVKTNISSAMNLIDACIDQSVKSVVALSIDKASSPINSYGATRLILNKLFVAANR